jgi:hypothetical protein
MAKSNLERMMDLADEVFDMRNDPDQLSVDDSVIEKLQSIHPSTLSNYDDGDGPVAWVLVIPTTMEIMNQFLGDAITEKELFDLTMPGMTYDALYLCSALVLEEYRRKGITKRLVLDAIDNINQDHPLKALFVWPFTEEGAGTAEAISRITGIPLNSREI